MRGFFRLASGGVASLNRPAYCFDASGIGTVILSLTGYWVLGTGYWVLGTGYWVLGTWHLALGTWHLALGTWHLALGTWHLALLADAQTESS
jgi:hypothetical protein